MDVLVGRSLEFPGLSKICGVGGNFWPRAVLMAIISHFNRQNWASHHVPYIFFLVLTSSTSFRWVVLAGDSIPKNEANWTKFTGRPASPRPASLAPLHIVPHLQTRGKVTPLHCLYAVDCMSVSSNEPKGIYHGFKGPQVRTKNQWSTTLDNSQPLISNIGERRVQRH